MQNKEGIFSYHELHQLRDFCNDCAKEDKRIYEQRKKNSSYMPEDKKPEPFKKANSSSISYNNNKNGQNQGGHQIQNNSQGNIKGKKVNNHSYNSNYNNNGKMQFNYSKMNSDTFKNRVKMYEQ